MADEFKLGDTAPSTATPQGNLGPVPGVKAKRTYTRRASGERAPRRTSRTNPKTIYMVIGTGVAGANKLGNLNKVWKESLFLRPDEVQALSVALGDEAMSHKQLIKWLEDAAENMVHIKLASVILALTVPRLAVLGMLPKELVDVFSVMVEQGQQTAASAPEQGAQAPTEPASDDHSTVPNGTGRTREFYRTNGERQEYGSRGGVEPGSDEPSWERVSPATVQDSATVETG